MLVRSRGLERIGKYELLRRIAVGGMAEVFLARAAGPHNFEKIQVVKRMLPHLAEDTNCVEMFLYEARATAALTHPNIVQIYDFGQAGGEYYIAMEYIDGPNLRTILRQQPQLPYGVATRVVQEISQALAFVHDFRDPQTGQPLKLIHRDISPENILISRTGNVKLVDFGVAKGADAVMRTKVGTIKGKFAYMAPEQIAARDLDNRTDIFALGVVLYEITTGKKPFAASDDLQTMRHILYDTPTAGRFLRSGFPEELQAIIDKALAKDRNIRYRHCRELIEVLAAFEVSSGDSVSMQKLGTLATSVMPAIPVVPPRAGTPGAFPPVTAAPAPSSPPPAEDLEILLEESAVAEQDEAALQSLASAEPGNVTAKKGRWVVAAIVATVALMGVGVAILKQDSSSKEGKTAIPTAPREVRARFDLESNPPAQVRFKGRVLGRTPLKVEVAETGEVRLELFSAEIGGRFRRDVTLTLAAGDNPRQTVTIESGELGFQLPDAIKVSLDGEPLGMTPLPNIKVFEGPHMVELFDPKTKALETIQVDVRPGETKPVVWSPKT